MSTSIVTLLVQRTELQPFFDASTEIDWFPKLNDVMKQSEKQTIEAAVAASIEGLAILKRTRATVSPFRRCMEDYLNRIVSLSKRYV